MQEKIDIQVLTVQVVIDDCRHISPNGETWGFYPIKADSGIITINYDLIKVGSKEYLL